MKVADLMTSGVITLAADATLREAWQIMRSRRIRQIPIVADSGLIGIVTDGDVKRALPSLFSKATANELDTVLDMTTVGRVMTKEPFVVSPDDPIGRALDLLLDKKIGGLPVVSGGSVIGIVTSTDFLKLVREQLSGSDA